MRIHVMSLRIRKFVRRQDEAVWVNVWNKAFREFDDFRSMGFKIVRTFGVMKLDLETIPSGIREN